MSNPRSRTAAAKSPKARIARKGTRPTAMQTATKKVEKAHAGAAAKALAAKEAKAARENVAREKAAEKRRKADERATAKALAAQAAKEAKVARENVAREKAAEKRRKADERATAAAKAKAIKETARAEKARVAREKAAEKIRRAAERAADKAAKSRGNEAKKRTGRSQTPAKKHTARELDLSSVPETITIESIAQQIRMAYLEATHGAVKERVLLKDLRPRVGVQRDDFDQALLSMQKQNQIVLMGLDNPVECTPEVEAAALHIAGNPRHLVYFQG